MIWKPPGRWRRAWHTWLNEITPVMARNMLSPRTGSQRRMTENNEYMRKLMGSLEIQWVLNLLDDNITKDPEWKETIKNE